MPSPGTQAAFKINTVTIDDTARASLSLNRTPIDVTSVGASYRTYEYGVTEGSVEIECFFDASHDTITNAFSGGTTLTNAEVQWATGVSIKGNAIVSNFSLVVAPNSVAQATMTLLFSGSALTFNVTP